MQPVQPGRIELVGAEVRRDAAVRGHRARAVLGDERHDRAGPAVDERSAHLDAVALEAAGGDAARFVSRALAEEPCPSAQLGHPGRNVRRLPAGAEPRRRVGVGARRERLAQADDHVEKQVAERDDHAYDPPMDGESRRSRTRSFLVGAAVGASAALAAARRLRPKERKRETPAGLAAFEEAPCYRELVESERSAP